MNLHTDTTLRGTAVICRACHGVGWVWRALVHTSTTTYSYTEWLPAEAELSCQPCEACCGSGREHCCDGLREQPEAPT